MVPAAKKQIDINRLRAEVSASAVELLSAQCATDRIRLQYLPQDVATHAERQILKKAIASAEAVHQFFSDIGARIRRQESLENDAR